MPSSISIGTKIGAMISHLAEAEPTNRLTNMVSPTIPTIVNCAGMLIAASHAAPLTAIRIPRFELENAAMNWAAKNAMTI